MISRNATLALFISAAALLAASMPARAAEDQGTRGPVGPNQALLASFGGKRVVAYYSPSNGHCDVNAIVWDRSADTEPYSSVRVRLDLAPGQVFQLGSTPTESLALKCGNDGGSLMIAN